LSGVAIPKSLHSRWRDGHRTTTDIPLRRAEQVTTDRVLVEKNRGGTAQSGAFRAFEGVPCWPLLRPWSRFRPAVRVVPLGIGPNLSRIRLGGVPLRWSHACLLQLPATDAKIFPILSRFPAGPCPRLRSTSL